MDFFDRYTSNTTAGSGNQSWFLRPEPDTPCTSRLFYRISAGGTYNYSLLFSNLIDGTFAGGEHSYCNQVCDEWTLHSVKAARSKSVDADGNYDFVTLTFDGKPEKHVHPGEMFASDPARLTFEAGDYMCLETTFSGRMIPNHPESLIPAFVKTPDGYAPSKELPYVSMLGCDRLVKQRIGFWGDSITQGIGTPENSYTHYAARLSDMLGAGYPVWDLGLGYGRAEDAASGGVWMYKALHNDVVCVCYGVNDLLRNHDPQNLITDLTVTVDRLKANGKKVLIQTVPPFDYDEETTPMWKSVNDYIRNTLAARADAFFDNVPVLCRDSEHPQLSKYGSHPDSEGNKAWAEKMYPTLKALLERSDA